MSKARRGRLFDQPALLKVVSSYTRLIDVTDSYTTDASGVLIAKGNITDNTPEGD